MLTHDAYAKAETFAVKRAIRLLGIACDIDGRRGLRLPNGRYISGANDVRVDPFNERIEAAQTPDEHNALLTELQAKSDEIPNAMQLGHAVLEHGKQCGFIWDDTNKQLKEKEVENGTEEAQDTGSGD